MTDWEFEVGFVGGGAMAEALIGGVLQKELFSPLEIAVSDVNEQRLDYLGEKFGIKTFSFNAAIFENASRVILAVKPQVMEEVLRGATKKEGQLFISIAAGITLSYLIKYLGENTPVVRVMPNNPCLIGEGASAITAAKSVDAKMLSQVQEIFDAVGKSWVVEEKLMDAVTGLSGSGPAYIYLILEALSDAGVLNGLPRELATLLAAQTIKGSAEMVLKTGLHPAKLKEMVTSPGGTTIFGLRELEEGKIRFALLEAVTESAKRSAHFSKEYS